MAGEDEKEYESLSKEEQTEYQNQAHDHLAEMAVSQAESLYEN
jgi:hypothetical protein